MVMLTKLDKKDFDKILTQYVLGKYVIHKHFPHALSNSVYALTTTSGKYILKVYECENDKFVKYQIRLTNVLTERGVKVPAHIKTTSGKITITYKNKLIGIQEFIEGKPLSNHMNVHLLKDLVKNVIALHQILLTLNFRNGDNWGYAHQFECDNLDYAPPNFPLQEEYNKYLKEVRKNVNPRKLRRSIVHGDLRGDNLIVGDNHVRAIIDFDDSHRDYLIYDIVTLFCGDFICGNKIYKSNMQLFLSTYQKELKLNLDEKKAIYYFMKQRYLSTINYSVGKRQKHVDQVDEINEWLTGVLNQYETFCKLPIEEFLSFF